MASLSTCSSLAAAAAPFAAADMSCRAVRRRDEDATGACVVACVRVVVLCAWGVQRVPRARLCLPCLSRLKNTNQENDEQQHVGP